MSQEKKEHFISRLPIFLGLKTREISYLAGHLEEYQVEEGGVAAFEKDTAAGLYILVRGILAGDRSEQRWHRGEYFDSSWLLDEGLFPETLVGYASCHFLLLSREVFVRFLDLFPGAAKRLKPELDAEGNLVHGVPLEVWRHCIRTRKALRQRPPRGLYLLPEEYLLYQGKRSRWYLAFRIGGIVLSLLVFPMLLFYLLTLQPTGTITGALALILPGVAFSLLLLWAALRTVYWSLDRFILTNKYIQHRKVDLKVFRTEVRKVPIDRILSVETLKSGILHNLVGIGRVVVKTSAGEGDIIFEGIDRPERVADLIRTQIDMARNLAGSLEHSAMRKAVEEQFGVSSSCVALSSEKTGMNLLDERYRKRKEKQRKRQYGSRSAENADGRMPHVCYRKSPWVLVLKLFPFLVIAIGFWVWNFPYARWVSLLPVLGALWFFEDWRNDRFELKTETLVDINRKPLGIREHRVEARLLDVQNIRAEQKGIIASLFNFGDLVIETGGTGKLVFRSLDLPWQVQADLFSWREFLLRKKQENEGVKRKEEYGVLLDVYHQEQRFGRIPRSGNGE